MGRLLASDGSTLEWEIVGTAKSAFTVSLKVIPPAGTAVEAEAHKALFASRDDAADWLRANARARGFDARGIK